MTPNKRYSIMKWTVLIGFCLMYVTVYLARYNINNMLPEISADLSLTGLQEDILYASVFFSYAVGSLVNGYISDKFSKKNCILFGIIGSLTLNIVSYMAGSWSTFLIINILNGYSQSIIWVSGLSMITQWWPYNRRGISVGLINMTSNISYLLMIFAPELLFIDDIGGWRENLIYPMAPIFIFAAVFVIMFADRPQSRGLKPYDNEDPVTVAKDAELESEVRPGFASTLKYFLTEPVTLIWACIALLSSLCRYGLLFWLPEYYSGEAAGFILGQNLTNVVLSLGMGVGTLIGCIIAGRYFSDNLGLIVTALATSCAAVIITFPALSSKVSVISAIFLCGTLLFAINGMLWMYSVNRGSRVYAGTVTGILNAFAYLGASMQIFLFKFIVSLTGDWMFVFVSIEVLCILMVLLGLLISRKDRTVKEL